MSYHLLFSITLIAIRTFHLGHSSLLELSTDNDKIAFSIPKIPYFNPEGAQVTKLNIITYCIGLIAGVIYTFKKNWISNNILGMAFSIFGIENLALGEFKVGLILLSLLFFYDIFWVFYTPVMVSVAKNIEGPVKLMFPKLQITKIHKNLTKGKMIFF